MKLLVKGLRKDVTAEEVRQGMERLGPVDEVEVVPNRSPAATDTWAIVIMPVPIERAYQIANQVSDLWHDGRRVSISVMAH